MVTKEVAVLYFEELGTSTKIRSFFVRTELNPGVVQVRDVCGRNSEGSEGVHISSVRGHAK